MECALQYRIASCGPHGQKYRPEFRRSPTQHWFFMRKDGVAMEFNNATAAKTAAEQIVALDEASRSPARIIEVEPEPLGSIDDWRRQKDAEAEAERKRVFGGDIPARLFRHGREIKVEVRRAR